MLSSGNLGVGIGLDVLWRLNAAAVNYATTWSFAAYAQANNGALPGPWADVRRTGTATYENASGVITTLPDLGGGTYAARVQYRSGTARGLLIEGQATQLSGYTGAFDNAAWGKSGGASITANAVAGPGGSTTADLLTATGATSILYQTFAGAGTYSLQIKFKANATQQVCIDMSIGGNGRIATFNTNGSASVAAKGTGAGASGGTASVVAVAGGWYLAKFEGLVTSAGLYAIVSLPAAGSVYIDEWQLEAGSVCTSYIPNASSGSVVRKGDFEGVFLTSTALSAAFPGGVGQPWTTVFSYIKGYSVSSDETLFALSAGSSAGSTNLLALQTNGTQAQAVHSGGSGTLSGTLVHDGSTVNKIALSVDPTWVAELVVGGNFDSLPTGMTAITTTQLISGGVGRYTATDATGYRGARLTKSGVVIGKTYIATARLRIASGTSTVNMGFVGGSRTTAVSSSSFVEQSISFVANGTTIYLDILFNGGGAPNAIGDAFEVDDISIKETGKVSVSVNGATAVETTGIAYTGSGTTHLIPGARTTGGSTPVAAMEIYDWRNVNTSYTTGASLQALSA